MTRDEFLDELFVAVRHHAQKQVERDHANHWEVRNKDEKIDHKMDQMIWYMAEFSAKNQTG